MTFEYTPAGTDNMSEVEQIVLSAVRGLGGQATAAQIEKFEGVAERLGRLFWATDILESLHDRGLIRYYPESEKASLIED